jgi:hypothetical protein
MTIKMDKREWIKYFNQCLTTILNEFSANSILVEEVVVEYYTSTLHASISMFVKRARKKNLVEKFKESKNV